MINKILPILIIILFIFSFSNITYSFSINQNNKFNNNLEEYYRFINYQNGSLSGYVNDTLSNPIDGALVNIRCGELHMYNNSDSTGFYFIDNIPIVDCYWNVSASKGNYDTSYVDMSIDINSSHDFILTSSINILFVGGNGPNNYTRIQDAIYEANDGDTVYVYNGIYYENILINKKINITGENRDKTIIDGNGKNDSVHIISDFVNISHFTIRNSGINRSYYDSGIDITSNYNVIYNNRITSNIERGLTLYFSNNNWVSNNIISENGRGIFMVQTENNFIKENIIKTNNYGIYTTWGFLLNGCINTNIIRNSIRNNDRGIYLNGGSGSSVKNNNFIDNNLSASFYMETGIIWDSNYWDKSRYIPKLIFGVNGFFIFRFPVINIDFNPAKEPYEI